MAKKSCTNPSCPFKGKSVETDRNNCMSCGRSLSNPLGGLLGDLGGLADDLFGARTSRTTMPNEVRLLLERVDSALARIVNSEGPTTKGALRALREDIRRSLEEYGR